MTRLVDWPERLEAFLRERAARPFAWGAQDCVTFAADAVEAMTGVDPIADLRGRWTTPRQALREMERHGGLWRAILSRLEEIPIGEARRGDVGLILGRRPATVVVLADRVVGPGRDGLCAIPRDQLVSAYRVP